MILTEEEAKTKVCPEVSGPVVHDDGRSYPMLANCIGAACMAWRWGVDPNDEYRTSDTYGFCGKAGKP